ncbi:MAG: hypothetical protein ACI4AA_00800 [Lachnospiraceae bacterium]
MKCEFCGANIDIESEVCPFCGMKKSQFEKHRKDMGRYSRAFHATRDTVVEENRKFSSKAASITIISILIVAILILLIGILQCYDIHKAVLTSKLMRNSDTYISKLDEYESSGNFEAFASYYEENSLYYADDKSPYSQYQLLYYMSSNYSDALQSLFYLRYPVEANSTSQSRQIEYFLTYYEYFQNYYNDYMDSTESTYYYDKGCFSEKHMASAESMWQNMNHLIISYLGVSEDQIEDFQNANTAHRTIMLEETLSSVQDSGEMPQEVDDYE